MIFKCRHVFPSPERCGVYSQMINDGLGKRVEVVTHVCRNTSVQLPLFFAAQSKCTNKLVVAFDFEGNMIDGISVTKRLRTYIATEENFHRALRKQTKLTCAIANELKQWGIIITPKPEYNP